MLKTAFAVGMLPVLIVFFLFWSDVVSSKEKDVLSKQIDKPSYEQREEKIVAGTKKPAEIGNGPKLTAVLEVKK